MFWTIFQASLGAMQREAGAHSVKKLGGKDKKYEKLSYRTDISWSFPSKIGFFLVRANCALSTLLKMTNFSGWDTNAV